MNWITSVVPWLIEPISIMTEKKGIIAFSFLFFFSGGFLSALNLGLHCGVIGKPATITYGLSLETGLLIPFCKLEFEGAKRIDTEEKHISAAILFNPRFRTIRPYISFGLGTEFKRLDLHFNRYRGFSFFGGGVHFYFSELLSLRFDLRRLNYGDLSRLRLSAGLFAHL